MKMTNEKMGVTKRKPWLAIAMVVYYCTFSNNANVVFADTDTTNLNVNTTINAKCMFKTGAGPGSQNISFGEYDPVVENAATADTSSASISAKCTKNTSAQIAMGTGLHSSSSTSTSRAMSDGAGSYLSYEIYSDASMTTVWNTTNTVAYTDTGGPATNLPIYAAIPPAQNTAAGNYTDTVTMTISY